MNISKPALIGVGMIALMGAGAPAAPRQVVTGPVAVYWMSAQTLSGMVMGGAGGPGAPGGRPGRPSMGQMFGQAFGGGDGGGSNISHLLLLQLGSSTRAPAPAADHLPPPGLGAGAGLPLISPAQPTPEPSGDVPRDFQRPHGRMLIFWGCGDHAGPGQPVTVDFAEMSAAAQGGPAGKAAAARIAGLFHGVAFTPMQPPSPTRNATYGEWPNARSRASVPPQGSLLGEHVVRGNYSPEIRFSLAQGQDFLPPISVITNAKAPSGGVSLGWRPVAGAQAYMASAMGGEQDTVVIWVSSQTQAVAFALPDYLSQDDLRRLVAQQTLMSPQTTGCTVPADAVRAAPQMLYNLAAYGAEANFSYPARPADPKVAWNIQWTAKVRYRSATGGLLGTPMPGEGDPQQQPPKKKRGLPFNPLGGIIPGQ